MLQTQLRTETGCFTSWRLFIEQPLASPGSTKNLTNKVQDAGAFFRKKAAALS